jgi:hypothetical protein
MAENESTDEYRDSGENRVEEIECANRADTDEVKQRAFDAQVSEGLVQTLEDPVAALLGCDLTWHKPLDCGFVWVEKHKRK